MKDLHKDPSKKYYKLCTYDKNGKELGVVYIDVTENDWSTTHLLKTIIAINFDIEHCDVIGTPLFACFAALEYAIHVYFNVYPLSGVDLEIKYYYDD